MQFNLNDDINFILGQLNKYGTGFLVGGALRDLILGKDPGDYDFATDIEYKELKRIFKDYNPKEVGAHFGILMITVNGKEYEIAKFRKESGIYNSRYPKMIKFVNDITVDLERRDFTINALAYNENSGVIDVFDSKSDIEKGIIRFVGNPKLRIEEDSLRIMRAFRFISKLGFVLDKKTAEAIFEKRKFLNKISRERVFDELKKTLLGKYPKKSLLEMKRLGVLELIIPEYKYAYTLNDYYNNENLCINDSNNSNNDNDNDTGNYPKAKENLFNHTLKVIENTEEDVILRISALFHDLGKVNNKTIDAKGNIFYDNYEIESVILAENQLKYLKASNDMINSVKKIIKNQNIYLKNTSDKDLKKLILNFGDKDLDRLLKLIDANYKAHKKYVSPEEETKIFLFNERIQKIKSDGNIPTIRDINITGVDLINLKFHAKEIGNIKSEIYELILEEKLQNEKEEIVNYLIEKYREGYMLENEKSCGAVVYNDLNDKFLLVKILNGNWGFPKGHIEDNETEIETAYREVKEETGLDVILDEKFRESIKYLSDEKTLKEVIFFLGLTKETKLLLDEEEIEDFEWCSYEKAIKMVTYKVQKEVLEKVKKYLNKKNNIDIALYI